MSVSPGLGVQGSGLGVQGSPRIRLELNSEAIVLRWNLNDWKKLESLYEKNGLKKKERFELFRTRQSSPKYVYIYPRSLPAPKTIRDNDGIEIVLIDDVDSRQIIDVERSYRIVVNRAMFRVVPVNGVTTIEYGQDNVYIPEIKQNYGAVLRALKLAVQDVLNEMLKVRFKLIMEVY